jgi:hypothetical protein
VPVVAVFQSPGFTQEGYEKSVVGVTGGKSRVDSPSEWPVEGLLADIAGQGPNGFGFRVVDVWESEEAFNRFGETLMPILQELGVKGSRRSIRRTHWSRPDRSLAGHGDRHRAFARPLRSRTGSSRPTPP